jgi:hypothetical protein
MTRSEPSWFAAVLLRFVASENDALAGDLTEELRSGRSRRWFWLQVFRAAAVVLWSKRKPTPAVVRLVTTTPYDRPDRTLGLLDPATINLSGTKVRGIGSLGLLSMIMLVTIVMPQAWFLVLTGLAGGIVVGIVLVRRRRDRGLSGPSDRRPLALFEEPVDDAPRAVAPARRAGQLEQFVSV